MAAEVDTVFNLEQVIRASQVVINDDRLPDRTRDAAERIHNALQDRLRFLIDRDETRRYDRDQSNPPEAASVARRKAKGKPAPKRKKKKTKTKPLKKKINRVKK